MSHRHSVKCRTEARPCPDKLGAWFGRFDPAFLVGAWPVESRVLVETVGERSLSDRGNPSESAYFVSRQGPFRPRPGRVVQRRTVEAESPVDVRIRDMAPSEHFWTPDEAAIIRSKVKAGMAWDAIALSLPDLIEDEHADRVEAWRPVPERPEPATTSTSYPVGGTVSELRRWRSERASEGRAFVHASLTLT